MELLSQLNSPVLYLISGAIILIVAVTCLVFAVRAYKTGKAMGIDTGKMKRVITASATFSSISGIMTPALFMFASSTGIASSEVDKNTAISVPPPIAPDAKM